MDMMVSRTRGTNFADREKYVNGLTLALNPLRDFDSIKYGHFYSTDEEYIKISDTIGSSLFLNVTALTKAQILKEVAKVVLQGEIKGPEIVPETLITDKNELRKIAPLFR